MLRSLLYHGLYSAKKHFGGDFIEENNLLVICFTDDFIR
jgi:hypothetical protein